MIVECICMKVSWGIEVMYIMYIIEVNNYYL